MFFGFQQKLQNEIHIGGDNSFHFAAFAFKTILKNLLEVGIWSLNKCCR